MSMAPNSMLSGTITWVDGENIVGSSSDTLMSRDTKNLKIWKSHQLPSLFFGFGDARRQATYQVPCNSAI
jgi:hypothetical protein